jgi:hypothetical protein
MAQVIEHLPRKHVVLSSNPITTKKKIFLNKKKLKLKTYEMLSVLSICMMFILSYYPYDYKCLIAINLYAILGVALL